MPDNNELDDLEAFFLAAENDDPEALDAAAENVAGTGQTGDDTESSALKPPTASYSNTPLPDVNKLYKQTRTIRKGKDSEKYVAIEPSSTYAGDAPFVVVPQGIASSLPWWAWTAIVLVIAVIFSVIVFMPEAQLSSLTARLSDSTSTSQAAIRQLILRGDDRTVEKLYGLAASSNDTIETRLRAVDTLSLIRDPSAERALLRLELASGTDARVRQHAIAARRQRESSAMPPINR